MAAPLEPDPNHWLNNEKQDLLREQFTHSAQILRQSGLWRATLSYWVRWQISLEYRWEDADREKEILQNLLDQWNSNNNNEHAGLSQPELISKLRVNPASAQWSRKQWHHKIESLYLSRKSQIDRASCKLIRFKDKNLANEIYHRIKNSELSFEYAARKYGFGPERHQGGIIKRTTIEDLPFGLAPLISSMSPGTLSLPLRMGQAFCIVQLDQFHSRELDTETEEFLLAEHLRLWIDSVVDLIVNLKVIE